MLPVERHRRIREALRRSRVVSTEELAHLLEVSSETVRRDLVVLEQKGHLRRVHGGASLIDAGEEAPFGERATTDLDEKTTIGRLAAAMITPGLTLIIDVGTTALEVARAIPADYRGTVATPSLHVAAELAGRPGVTVLVPGGRLRSGDLALSNAHTVAFFADLRADLAFLGSGGITLDGLTDFHLDEVASRLEMLRHSGRCFVLADGSKIGRIAPYWVCALDRIAGVVTDRAPEQPFVEAVARSGGIVVSPDSTGENSANNAPTVGRPRRQDSRVGSA